MKKFFVLSVALMLVFSLAVTARADEYYIGVSIFDYSNNFVGYIRNGIEFYVDEINTAGGDLRYFNLESVGPAPCRVLLRGDLGESLGGR